MRLNRSDPLSEILTIQQAAALPNVGKSPATLRWWIHEGYLQPHRIGRRTYVTERAVLAAQHATHARTTRRATRTA